MWHNFRNELGIVRVAMKEEDKVKDDPVVMENQRIYSLYMSFVSSLEKMSATSSRGQLKRPIHSTQCQHL